MKIRAPFLSIVVITALGAGSTSIVKGDHVDDVIAAQMKERHIPAVALAVIQRSRIIREQSYGFADAEKKEHVTTSTLFQAASVSKPVAALGALHLVEQGKVSLDENVDGKLRSWHLPENRFTRVHPVTLRLILSHSAGLTVSGFRGYRVGTPLPSLLQILDGQAPANSAPVRVDQIPGSQWRYSGGGYLVLQQMMIDITGRSFADYMEETVLKPLGMSSITFVQPLPESWARRAATGYTGTPRRAVEGRWHVKPELAAGGMWTTAGDLARFYIGIQHSLSGTSKSVISPSMTRQMLTVQNGESGLGFMVGGTPLRFGHNGDNVGFNAVTIAFETGEGAVILMNANTDIEVLKNILVEAIGEQYRWPGYPLPRKTPN
ncbi:MAG: serine hydrolase domain-containing protein [Verrucomicrobiota bacterium]